MTKRILGVALALLGWSAVVQGAEGSRPTVLWGDTATEVSAAPAASPDLWVTTADLTRATGFVLKPQGVCRDELCFPIPKAQKAEFLADRSKATWFNLRLNPDSWNYKRQAWALSDARRDYGTSFGEEVKKLNGKPYYTPRRLSSGKNEKEQD